MRSMIFYVVRETSQKIRGVFHWLGPKCQQSGDFTQQEVRVKRHSVGVPYWRSGRVEGGKKKKKDKRDGSRFSCYNSRRERARACFQVWKNAILSTHLSKFRLFLPAQSVIQRYLRCGVHS